MKSRCSRWIPLLLSLSVLACQVFGSAQDSGARPPAEATVSAEPASATMASATAAVAATGTTAAATQTTDVTPAPVITGKPPQTNAAALQPPERREELTVLSNLLTFRVTGLNGAEFGQVADYIVNTCETYIIYFVVDPAADLGLAAGHRLVIPFEAVTINSGILKADERAIALYLAPEQLKPAPAFANPLPLFPRDWETSVRTYWQQVVRVSGLHSECKAGGSDSANAVHKIAYATTLLGAELKDFNQSPLGTVVEAVLEPESGKLGFYVVELVDGQGLVLVPLGKTNIPEAALEPGQTTELVLLAESGTLFGAPRLGSAAEASNVQVQGTARQYWGR